MFEQLGNVSVPRTLKYLHHKHPQRFKAASKLGQEENKYSGIKQIFISII
jgi:hypothetical protein